MANEKKILSQYHHSIHYSIHLSSPMPQMIIHEQPQPSFKGYTPKQRKKGRFTFVARQPLKPLEG
jgi:hypothetical protein